jgi:phosphoglycerate dehydrogenase-like enzyme
MERKPRAVYLLGTWGYDLIYGPEERGDLARLLDVASEPLFPPPGGLLPAVPEDVEAILSGWGCARLDEALLATVPRLRAVFYGAGSVRGVVTDALLKETEGLITGAHFLSMKPGAAFINTARGAVVREAEMAEAARQRPDLQFVLDVTYPEPPASGSPLYSLPNVVLTPHIAGSMGRECRRMGRFMVDEVRRYLAGEPLQGEVTRETAPLLA